MAAATAAAAAAVGAMPEEEELGVAAAALAGSVAAQTGSTEAPPARSGLADTTLLTPLELVAKNRAPVKREYLRPRGSSAKEGGKPPEQTEGTSALSAETGNLESRVQVAAPAVPAPPTAAGMPAGKKSRRQQKRERQQVRPLPFALPYASATIEHQFDRPAPSRLVMQAKVSAEHVCAAVARAGRTDACPYGAACRFNHDLAGFLAQKPADLDGDCPFAGKLYPCPFGLACRFAGRHAAPTNGVEAAGVAPEQGAAQKKGPEGEANGLSKELQKLLWKNRVAFPRADAYLRAHGLLSKGKVRPPKGLPGEDAVLDDTSGKEGDDGLQDASEGLKRKVQEIVGECEPASLEEGMALHSGNEDALEADGVKRPRMVEDGGSHALEEQDGASTGSGVNGSVSEATVAFPHGDVNTGAPEPARAPPRERQVVDFRGKLYLAPLTTVGNLPFRRVAKTLGADITCGEMAMCTNLLQASASGQASEWALLRRHASEDVFGVQICGAHPDTLARTAEIVERECQIDFLDINMGCPIDLVVNKGAGSCLLTKPMRLEQCLRATSAAIDSSLTVKVRMAYYEGKNCAHNLIPNFPDWGASAVVVHGRTRQQRYSRTADWDYIRKCRECAPSSLQVIGNGDVFSFTDWNERMAAGGPGVDTCMLARGVLIKPWLLTEIKEQRHWDISSGERFAILQDYARFGLEHWGSDTKGVETTRHYLLEWLGFLHRYIPVGLLDILPQKMNWRPPSYFGRNDLETLMASDQANDWIKLSEMLLGPTPANFSFVPKHKSNSYDLAENG
eukprot:SM000029S10477  [mRNA]  locus=s29:375519:382061:- [translate_table: standard]